MVNTLLAHTSMNFCKIELSIFYLLLLFTLAELKKKKKKHAYVDIFWL